MEKLESEGRLNAVEAASAERQREILNRPLSARTIRYRKMKEKTQNSLAARTDEKQGGGGGSGGKGVVQVTVA